MSSKRFTPYIPAETDLPEFTLKAIVLGILMAVVLGAANAYLGLKAGLTISATFPAAVVAIAAFRLPFMRGNVLEQNIARTAASVGEALVAGAIFTIPAFLIARVDGQPVWEEFDYWSSTWIMLVGGVLGVLFVILLRRTLVEDAALPFPESAACAELVKAGQKGESGARYVFGAIGLSAVLELFKNARGIELIAYTKEWFLRLPRSLVTHGSPEAPMGEVVHRGGAFFAAPAASPALIAVGYIIGPRLSAVAFSGGAFGWLFLVPLLLFIDPDLAARVGSSEGADVAVSVWRNYVRPIAVGAMLVGAVHTLVGLRGSLSQAFRRVLADFRKKSLVESEKDAGSRLEVDVSLKWITLGIVATVIPMTLLYWHFTHSVVGAVVSAVIMTITGFLFRRRRRISGRTHWWIQPADQWLGAVDADHRGSAHGRHRCDRSRGSRSRARSRSRGVLRFSRRGRHDPGSEGRTSARWYAVEDGGRRDDLHRSGGLRARVADGVPARRCSGRDRWRTPGCAASWLDGSAGYRHRRWQYALGTDRHRHSLWLGPGADRFAIADAHRSRHVLTLRYDRGHLRRRHLGLDRGSHSQAAKPERPGSVGVGEQGDPRGLRSDRW